MNKKVILVVDDSEFDRSLLVKVLTKKGDFEVLQAADTSQCLNVIKETKVDLILMDIMMPGTIGTQALQIIREQFNAIELPIIMITAKTDVTDVLESLQLGANDYITKPVNFDIAVSRITTHLKLADVSHEMRRLQEIFALDAMISTYNHEINNPLSIAIGTLKKLDCSANKEAGEVINSALWEIADIVKKVGEISEKKEVQYESYSKSTSTLKIK